MMSIRSNRWFSRAGAGRLATRSGLAALTVLGAASPGWCGSLFFTATDNSAGTELWRTDGTSSGTNRVRDIFSGSGSSSPSSLTAVGPQLFFSATTPNSGTELWRSDGTSTGTFQVREIASGTTSSAPANLFNANGVLYFSADNGTNGRELWRSDGTSNGTFMVRDINNGISSSNPRRFTLVNGIVFFTATTSSGEELWRTDGTSNNTFMVRDINTSSGLGSNPAFLTPFGNRLLFNATTASSGTEPWITDGTSNNTFQLADINSGVQNGASGAGNFHVVGSVAYFRGTRSNTGEELWKTDGSTSGTTLVRDIFSGSNSSGIRDFAHVNSTLYFVATDGSSGDELWKSDGTTAGTVRVSDINSGSPGSAPHDLIPVGNVLYFGASTGNNGDELWKTNGTTAGTIMVKDINPGSVGSTLLSLTNFKTRILFHAQTASSGDEPWISTGTAAGTAQLADTQPGSTAGVGGFNQFYVNGNIAYFLATNSSTGTELWKTDGTTAGTGLVRDINSGNASSSPAQGVYVNTTNDTTGPSVDIATPANKAVLTTPNSITGTATDKSGGTGFTESSAFVLLTLNRASDGLYWNGTSWEAGSTWLPTTLSNVGLGCTWTSNFTFPADWTSGQYAIYARAYDGAGNPSNTDKVLFTISGPTTSPSIAITSPANGSSVTSLATISGTVSIPTGGSISSVVFYLRRGSDNFYWNGSSWVSARTGRTASRSGGTWTLSGGPSGSQLAASGKYYLAAYATSTDGGTASAAATVTTASGDTTPPVVTITSPANGSTVTSIGTISGSAIDESGGSGLRDVTVFLRRGSDNFYWTGSAWTASRTGRVASLSGSGWFLTGGPGSSLSPGAKYYIAAYARDNGGSQGSASSTVQTASALRDPAREDTVAPTVTIDSPQNGAVVKSLGTLSGAAFDDENGSGLAGVTVTIRRSYDNASWTGSSWSDGARATAATALPATTSGDDWSLAGIGALSPGVNYTITATVTDRSGNSSTATVTVLGQS